MNNTQISQNLSLSPGVKKSKSKPRYWNEEEDSLLKAAIQQHGSEGYHKWKEVAKSVPNRSYRECMQRWTKVLAPGLKKGKWSSEEDELLKTLVNQQLQTLGDGNGKRLVWSKVAEGFEGRSCKQCRERWINHLDPDVNKGEWSQEEDLLLLQLFDQIPNKWAKIARQIKGRTENMVKVRWNALNRQAKKRKQNSLYYPIGASATVPNQYNQFYMSNNGFMSPTAPPTAPAQTQSPNQQPLANVKLDESRKNSLYLFPNSDWVNFGADSDLASFNNLSREEQVRRMSLAKMMPSMGMMSDPRRLSFQMGNFNFEDPNEMQKHGRRLSSFLYQDLVKNMNFPPQFPQQIRTPMPLGLSNGNLNNNSNVNSSPEKRARVSKEEQP